MAGKFGAWTAVLSGLPFDVQATLYTYLVGANNIPDARSVYRMPLLTCTSRLTITAGGNATGSFKFNALSVIYGLSASFQEESTAITDVHRDEIDLKITFNNGSTTWIGSSDQPCSLSSVGDGDHPTRLDPLLSKRSDVWNVTLTDSGTVAATAYSRVTVHGIQLYSTAGAFG